MWVKWVDWRLLYKADEINIEDIKEELATQKCILHSHDKHNRPCLIIRPRFHDPKNRNMNQFMRAMIYLVEQAVQESERLGSKQICVSFGDRYFWPNPVI